MLRGILRAFVIAAFAAGSLFAVTGAQALTFVTTVSALGSSGSLPMSPVVSKDNRYAYVSLAFDNAIAVIDVATNTQTSSIPLQSGSSPFGIALSPDGTRLWVAGVGGVTSVIDTSTEQVIQTISLPTGHDVKISPDGTTAYLVQTSPAQVSVIDTASYATRSVISLTTGSLPFLAAISPNGNTLYVTGHLSAKLSVVDLQSATYTDVPVGTGTQYVTMPFGVAVSPDGSAVYVGNSGEDSVTVMNAASLATSTVVFPTGSGPSGAVVSPDGLTAYITGQNDNQLYALRTATAQIEGSLSTGAQPTGVAISPNGHWIYVADNQANSASVFQAPVVTAPSREVTGAVGTVLSSGPVTATGFTGPVGYTIAPALPPGLTFNSSTGEISGTVAAAFGPTAFIITGTDGTFTAATTVTLGSPATLAATGVVSMPVLFGGVSLVLLGTVLRLRRRAA